MNSKKILACGLCAGMVAGTLGGCYSKSKLSVDELGTTVVATYGTQEVMADELNYYIKMLQANYDTYYNYLYRNYYSTLKDFYNSKPDSERDITMWDSLKESAMSTLYQTYVLESIAGNYSVSLTDEDKEKIKVNVDEYFNEGNKGVIDAIGVNEERLTEILTRNAIAVKVYDKLVEDIDTTVDEADYRYVQVAYLKITKAETEAETTEEETVAGETTLNVDEKEVDLKAAAEKVMAEWKAAITDEKEYSDAASSVVSSYSENTEIKVASMSTSKYTKPTEDTTDLMGKYCYENFKTGDFDVYEDTSASYVLYCITDDEPTSKESAIEKELDNRRSDKFKEKYPDIVKACPTWDYKSGAYSKLKYAEIDYEEVTEAETTTAEATTADITTVAETTVAETTQTETAEETTEEETTVEESVLEETPADETPAE